MIRNLFIDLSRNDLSLVSYFPGLELKDNSNRKRVPEWINDFLIPAVHPILKRRTVKITEMPITFWIDVRGTARRAAEIFLFTTPAYPGSRVEDALRDSLAPLKAGQIHAGKEFIPQTAYPCLQIFRGKLIRFFSTYSSKDQCNFFPVVKFKDRFPNLELLPSSDLEKLGIEPGQIIVEARINNVMNGDYFRRLQQSYIPIAQAD